MTAANNAKRTMDSLTINHSALFKDTISGQAYAYVYVCEIKCIFNIWLL